MKGLLIVFTCVMVLGVGIYPALAQDSDGDGILDEVDNCLLIPNGPNLGTCVKPFLGIVIPAGDSCTDDSTCGTGKTCQKTQGDSNDDGIGDVCECYADFNGDGAVAISDVFLIKSEWGRTDCDVDPCETDMNADGVVSLKDLGMLQREYGRFNCPVPEQIQLSGKSFN